MGKGKNLLITQAMSHWKRGRTDPYSWVFSSVDNRCFNYNSRYLFEYVRENVKEVTPYFVINDRESRERLGREYGKEYFLETNTAAGIRRVLEAGVWFTSAGLPVYGTGLGKNRLIVNLWHGIPLKRIALLDPHLGRLPALYFKKIFSDNYTCILTSSKRLVPVMAKSFGVEKDRIRVWGQPRNDGLLREIDRERVFAGILGELPDYERTILYAPTYREYEATRLFPFGDFDRDALERFLEKEKLLLFLRTHSSEKASAKKFVSRRVRYLGAEEMEDVTGALGCFDALVTDYSSIYIDYLLLNRPLVFLPYDLERYERERGFNFPYDKVTPGPRPRNFQEFLETLKQPGAEEELWEKKRKRVRDFFHEVPGPCAEIICENILRQIREGTAAKYPV